MPRLAEFGIMVAAEVEETKAIMGDDYWPYGIANREPVTRALPPPHAFMHRTRTIDYVVVLQGEIDMLLDDSTVRLKAGDIVVQQGTDHAWVNRGTEVWRIALVLVDATAP
ncbi:cupin domain-containing protein [Roseiarcaceae bacterium H3SJ34-1]|uniref:cupin domain-containing protein n=1 Tax=Terripilifer ovatus TaxID=3032367 RepID=UPI003AB982AB|nr:cupin domain-containing protein [Roseiarcaceae bacterium H3SJ34-1]